jgi:hypothetical protein
MSATTGAISLDSMTNDYTIAEILVGELIDKLLMVFTLYLLVRFSAYVFKKLYDCFQP